MLNNVFKMQVKNDLRYFPICTLIIILCQVTWTHGSFFFNFFYGEVWSADTRKMCLFVCLFFSFYNMEFNVVKIIFLTFSHHAEDSTPFEGSHLCACQGDAYCSIRHKLLPAKASHFVWYSLFTYFSPFNSLVSNQNTKSVEKNQIVSQIDSKPFVDFDLFTIDHLIHRL